MIPQLEDVLTFLESVAPSHLAEPWDNPGLQVVSSVRKIQRVFVALDPTIQAVRRASQARAQLLLTHHPLIFTPISIVDVSRYPGNVVSTALIEGISVVALHTNLDAARGGINDILSDLLDLKDVQVLEERKSTDVFDKGEGPDRAFSYYRSSFAQDTVGTGLGRIGNLRDPCTLSEMAGRLKGLLGKDTLRVVGESDRHIARVAVLGGSGGSMIELAFKKGADLFLTGDIGHHHALEARSMGISLIDGGHFSTENAAMRVFSVRLADAFKKKDWEVDVEFGSDESDPIRFV